MATYTQRCLDRLRVALATAGCGRLRGAHTCHRAADRNRCRSSKCAFMPGQPRFRLIMLMLSSCPGSQQRDGEGAVEGVVGRDRSGSCYGNRIPEMFVLPIVPIHTLMAHLDERPTDATLHEHACDTAHPIEAISGDTCERGGFRFIRCDDLRHGVKLEWERAPAPGRG